MSNRSRGKRGHRALELLTLSGVLLVCGALAPAVEAQQADTTLAATADTTAQPPRRRVDLAVQQTLLSNFVVNRFNAWALGERWARDVDFESWSRNLRLGWEWDEDKFTTNMFGHPYQGASYFNAGRANGLSYWESVPLAFFGSWTWEYFGETNRPSLNDFFTTGFGGIAVGEMSHRVAATIRDERARGAGRIARETAAFVINPLTGLNRLFRGQWTRVGPNPPEHTPNELWFGMGAGARNVYEKTDDGNDLAPMLLLDLNYGDPFSGRYREPFDVFTMHAQISTGSGVLNTLQTSGRLYQAGLPSWGLRVQHAFTVQHRFDYLNNPVYRFGGQSVDVGIVSRIPLVAGLSLHTRVAGGFLVLGAINSSPSVPDGDEYDFGPGVGAVLSADLVRGRTTYLSLYNRAEYLHSVSGTPADHVLAFTGLRGMLPIYRNVGVGFYLSGDARESRYTELPDVSRQFFESRVFVTVTSSRQAQPSEMR